MTRLDRYDHPRTSRSIIFPAYSWLSILINCEMLLKIKMNVKIAISPYLAGFTVQWNFGTMLFFVVSLSTFALKDYTVVPVLYNIVSCSEARVPFVNWGSETTRNFGNKFEKFSF